MRLRARAGRPPGAGTPRRPPTVSQWISVDGRPMHARAGGRAADPAAPPVILVHGLGMSSRYMEPLLDELAPYVRVVAVDLPGYGRSESPPRRLTPAGLADALDAWMGASGVPAAIVLGNSLGAQVIALLGVRHPARLTRAVLVGPTRDPAVGGRLRHLLHLVRDVPRERPRLIGIAVHDYLRAGPGRMWDLFAEALNHPEENHLRHLRVPTLVVRGSRDPIATQAWVERIVDLIPDARLEVVDGAPHAVNFSAPAPLARVVLDFTVREPGTDVVGRRMRSGVEVVRADDVDGRFFGRRGTAVDAGVVGDRVGLDVGVRALVGGDEAPGPGVGHGVLGVGIVDRIGVGGDVGDLLGQPLVQ